MCLGVPGRITEIEGSGTGRALVGSVEMDVDLHLTPRVAIGDYVMIHAGAALEVMNKEAAIASLNVLQELHSRERVADFLLRQIAETADSLGDVTLMEVCGTHTTAIARSGLKGLLPHNVELISGPGCPVCVTPAGEIDMALSLAIDHDATIVTFGDMLRVPGSAGTLETARSRGGRVSVVYSPLDAVKMAKACDQEVVFLAVGFETTAPLIAACVKAAEAEGVDNFSVLVSHRLVPPALEAVLADPETAIDGLLCPGHVSTVIGVAPYEPLAAEFGIPCVVAGFETLDVLEGIHMLLERLESGTAGVENQYHRAVSYRGSPGAQKEIDDVFEVVDASWRGLGVIKKSALKPRGKYERFDAVKKFDLRPEYVPEPPGCKCGEILGGRSKPAQCPLMGKTCLPDHPVGPCMVSSEGSCRAAYAYG